MLGPSLGIKNHGLGWFLATLIQFKEGASATIVVVTTRDRPLDGAAGGSHFGSREFGHMTGLAGSCRGDPRQERKATTWPMTRGGWRTTRHYQLHRGGHAA